MRTKAEIKKSLNELEKTADAELRALGDKAKQAMQQMQGQQVPPEQAQQMQAQFQEQQQAIIAKYEPQIKALGEEVSIDAVMQLLRDERTRGFVIEIETDSTVSDGRYGREVQPGRVPVGIQHGFAGGCGSGTGRSCRG
ncbi:MAG: hypothetical protein V9G14_19310 [Cypionkella sp.]